MILLPGVNHQPGQSMLLAMDAQALVHINSQVSANAGYKIRDRTYQAAVGRYLDRAPDLLLQAGAPLLDADDTVYSGAEHTGDPKLPNITAIPNLALPKGAWLFGSTMGHFHPLIGDGDWTQELYELQSPGLVLLDHLDGRPMLFVGSAGDKVAIKNACHMMLMNLSDQHRPLVTLDYANPDKNPADKELIERFGPLLAAHYDDREVVFCVNPQYVNSDALPAGVRWADAVDLRIRIDRRTRYDLGEFLIRELTTNPAVIAQFVRVGMEVRRASPEVAIYSEGEQPVHVRRPLALAMRPGSAAHRMFTDQEPSPTSYSDQPESPDAIPRRQKEMTRRKQSLIRSGRATKRLQVVVEGAGEWVANRYRPMFARQVAKGRALSVVYADDSTWSRRPASWSSDLRDWEVYLDKAIPRDLAWYEKLRADAVFVVTPDITHAALCRRWLDKASAVFVEKPFDAHLDNVDGLLRDIAFAQHTACLGLDHYQFYALDLAAHVDQVVDHLGGGLRSVSFQMLEARPLELGRERTLQHGLTMDMLCHLLAMLSYFGDLGSLDNIRVIDAGQYTPTVARDQATGRDRDISSVFHNELFSHVAFTYHDFASSDRLVEVTGVVGKGAAADIKLMEIEGLNGNSLRVDLSAGGDAGYPASHILFLRPAPDRTTEMMGDPYDPGRQLHVQRAPRYPLRRKIYDELMDDLFDGTDRAVSSALLLSEAYQLVQALGRLWGAVQYARGRWSTLPLNTFNPLRESRELAAR